jgi:hypothetical protein
MSNKHALEGYRAFPIIAWTVCICFALFVVQLTRDLKDAQAELDGYNLTLSERFEIANMSTSTASNTAGGTLVR